MLQSAIIPGQTRLCQQSQISRSSYSGRPHACRKALVLRVVSTSSHRESVLVDSVLRAVENTDGGLLMNKADMESVDLMLDALEQQGAQQEPRPLGNELLWGNYNVAYTSTSRAMTQSGNPAGGRFRGGLGRMLFRSTGIFQSVLAPDIATNKIEFKLLGCISGAVGLRGKVVPVTGGNSNADTVKVLFEKPVLSFGDLHLKIGPPSSVELQTQYLDERVRLGKGSRGSLFVFTRGGAADTAGMDLVGLQKSSQTALLAFSVVFCSIFITGALAWLSGPLPGKVLGVGLWLLGAAIGGVVRSGGIISDNKQPTAPSTSTPTPAPAANSP
ncbi:MAG: hypothetical protein WDW36_006652 [Sanguina aurantia]